MPGHDKNLQTDESLIWLPVVANCRMNRERGLRGVNSYEKEFRFDIPAFLTEQARHAPVVRWLDLCCGSGRALIEAAEYCQSRELQAQVIIEGWDLAGQFLSYNPGLSGLRLVANSVQHWHPAHPYDLITCVHGLHYVGDKLGLIEKSVTSLRPTGLFIANLDFKNVRHPNGSSHETHLIKRVRQSGLKYHPRRRMLTCEGSRALSFGLAYQGADDAAGKNYTGQEAVDSYYS